MKGNNKPAKPPRPPVYRPAPQTAVQRKAVTPTVKPYRPEPPRLKPPPVYRPAVTPNVQAKTAPAPPRLKPPPVYRPGITRNVQAKTAPAPQLRRAPDLRNAPALAVQRKTGGAIQRSVDTPAIAGNANGQPPAPAGPEHKPVPNAAENKPAPTNTEESRLRGKAEKRLEFFKLCLEKQNHVIRKLSDKLSKVGQLNSKNPIPGFDTRISAEKPSIKERYQQWYTYIREQAKTSIIDLEDEYESIESADLAALRAFLDSSGPVLRELQSAARIDEELDALLQQAVEAKGKAAEAKPAEKKGAKAEHPGVEVDIDTDKDGAAVMKTLTSVLGNKMPGNAAFQKMITYPTIGPTGFIVDGLPVYHSSKGSAQEPGTLFWITSGNKRFVVAVGEHVGTKGKDYKIIWNDPSVSVKTKPKGQKGSEVEHNVVTLGDPDNKLESAPKKS